jgi:uncharacterized protein YrrD
MQLQSGAKVETASGDTVGHLDRVVIDPRTKEITHLVVRKGLLFRTDKVISMDFIAVTDSDRVVLRDNTPDLDRLPDYEETHYVAADERAWIERGDAGPGVGSSILGTSDVPPGGAAPPVFWYPPAITGYPGFHGMTAVTQAEPGLTTVETERNIPDHTVALKEGARVKSIDGQHVGDLARLFVDPESGRATHFLISQGLLLRTQKVVPVAWVLDVGEDTVQLAVSSELLQSLSDYQD